MSKILVMRDRAEQVGILQSRRLCAKKMSNDGMHGGFVQNDEVLDPVAEPVGNDGTVIGETLGGVAICPSTFLEQRFRQVPMEKRGEGFDLFFQQRVGQAAVIIEPLVIHRAGALRQYSRPGNRKAIGRHVRAGQQCDIVGITAIAVARHVGGGMIDDVLRIFLEDIPDARPPPVHIERAFNLESGRRRAPFEIGGEFSRRRLLVACALRPACSRRSQRAPRQQWCQSPPCHPFVIHLRSPFPVLPRQR